MHLGLRGVRPELCRQRREGTEETATRLPTLPHTREETETALESGVGSPVYQWGRGAC